ncbi:MAG: Glycine betaine methyltransferase [Anaerolineales bacterium]|nr:Glycine betaine methyltransferase [Anaerolineales bacterium]
MQNAYERLNNALAPALAGADCLSGVGGLENGVSASYEQIVIDNEILDLVYRTCRGFAVDEETLAVDVVGKVISEDSGTFLDRSHTINYMRAGEVWMPALSDRQGWEDWAPESKTIVDQARDEAREILETHHVSPLPENVQQEISDILTRVAAGAQAG